MRGILFCSFFIFQSITAAAAPPLEAYGNLPTIRSMAISPGGARLAYLWRSDQGEFLSIYDFEQGPSVAARTDEVKARNVEFAGPDHIILTASETMKISGFRGKLEYSAAFSYNIHTQKFVQLLKNEEDLFPAQTGLGRIVGVFEGSDDVFMPAYMGSRYSEPNFSLLKVDLDTGRARVFNRGTQAAIDWIVDKDGTILAREDHDQTDESYSISTRKNGKWERLYKTSAEIPPISLIGAKSDRTALIYSDVKDRDGFSALYEMRFNGAVSPPIFSRHNSGVGGVLLDENRFIFGVRYDGLYPLYEFFDSDLEYLVNSVSSLYPAASVTLVGWSADFEKLLFYIAGSRLAPAYHVLDRTTMNLTKISSAYSGISDADVGEVVTIEYRARDGLKISALLTRPPEVKDRNSLPLIVIPHGGPESYDAVGFDWMAQYFASRGFLVFQPNFRGSIGFGVEFRDAGRGEWGRKMQDDITDGVRALIKTGAADQNRICIIGGSYGGYAALAGGAFTPELYQCVAAIAPVTDLPRMLIDEESESGKDSWVAAYWRKVIGDRKAERDKLEAISPVNHADDFAAPVLLLHGNDDTVVPYRQSKVMESALKRANKDVTLIKLKGEDHWLSTGETRLQTLRELDLFVARTIGAR